MWFSLRCWGEESLRGLGRCIRLLSWGEHGGKELRRGWEGEGGGMGFSLRCWREKRSLYRLGFVLRIRRRGRDG